MAKMSKMSKAMDPDQRVRANMRERHRVSEMNEMFKELLNLLPPSRFKVRLSRAQILREATNYILRLSKFLEHQNSDAISEFPHIFNNERNSNKDVFRRPLKSKEGGVAAFISRHELPENTNPVPTTTTTTTYIQPTTVVPFSQTNVYIAYF